VRTPLGGGRGIVLGIVLGTSISIWEELWPATPRERDEANVLLFGKTTAWRNLRKPRKKRTRFVVWKIRPQGGDMDRFDSSSE
jgi:hypothetical protein